MPARSEPPLERELAYQERIAALEAALRRAQRRLAKREDDREALVAAVYQGAHDAMLAMGGPPKTVARPSRDRRRSPEAALLHLTDWQLGKQTDSYGVEVCEQRVRAAVDKAIKLTAIQKEDHPVRECHLMLGGDLVEGLNIFPGQAYEVEASSFSQVMAAAALVREVVLSLLEAFEHVTIWEVSGNHGRLGRRGDYPREDNLDRMVGHIARDGLDQPRLTWHEPKGWHTPVRIGEYRALLVHGDQVKSFGGNVPAYGIIRKATAWSSGVVEPFTDVYLGHFHSAMQFTLPNGGRVFVTPSPESGNEYAREFVAARGRPGQRLHFVDPAKGRVTAEYLVDLG